MHEHHLRGMQRRSRPGAGLNRRRLLGGSGALIGGGLARGWARPVLAQQAPANPLTDRLYFAASGHNLADPFLSAWRNLGGEPVAGLPLSEERYTTGAGGVVQTFTNLSLIYDPTVGETGVVRPQSLSDDVIALLAPASARGRVPGCAAPTGDCQFFAATGHTLSGRIAAFWAANGGETFFGPPVTEPFFASDGAATQLFANAGLVDGGQNGVRLLAVGQRLAEAMANDPAFKPAPPSGGTTFLVKAEDGLRLRQEPTGDAPIVQVLPDNAEFIAATADGTDWMPGYADGFTGWVATSFLAQPPPLPPIDPGTWNPAVWQGAALGEANIRAEPITTARITRELKFGDPLVVTDWVAGEEVFEGADLWARLDDGGFIYARNVGRTAPVLPVPPPPDAPTWGRWIDVHLTQQLMTAYDGLTPVRTMVVTTGMAGWETPPGLFTIIHRVANETMTSDSIGAENFYRLEDVLFTQYFTDVGHALHFAWWRTPETIGRPGSHGCINLLLDDSRFMWDWATLGTPVLIRAT